MKIFLYIIAMFTTAGCVKSLLKLYKAYISTKWPEYSATIVESAYEEVEDFEGGVVYRVIITYRYMVGGEQYENSNYDFCNQSVHQYEREQLLARYPVGKIIAVRVNPKNPASAVIVAGVTYWHYIWSISYFVFLYLLLKALLNW